MHRTGTTGGEIHVDEEGGKGTHLHKRNPDIRAFLVARLRWAAILVVLVVAYVTWQIQYIHVPNNPVSEIHR